MRHLARLCAIALALWAGAARADTPPNGWDAARDPEAAARYAVHLRARELINAGSIVGLARDRARVLLEEAHAASSPDLRLRLDLGEIYYEKKLWPETIRVLQSAIDLAPEDPATLPAYPLLANAYAFAQDSARERQVYARYLPLITDDLTRATATLNLAEADMHQGDLESAIAGYRSTADMAAAFPNEVELVVHTGTLARWGLAIALDRSGDVAAGAREAKLAVTLDHEMLVLRLDPAVFFAPARERYWYVALGFIEYAKEVRDARGVAMFWRRAEDCWREYIDDAHQRAQADRWMELAVTRLERAHAQRLAAEARVRGRVVYPERRCLS